ncbi:hypothetical protein BC833DRAFT_620184 [Globomyces pollinis-pini]|nr:hypothetical protein BC833DRAFT_620184 [Globomyces pollinis-pini]
MDIERYYKNFKLILKAAIFDKDATKELIDTFPPHTVWSCKLIITSFYLGAIIGGSGRAITSAHQFLAENAHRLPKTKGGWFQYHKYKHRFIARAAIPYGVLTGFRMSFGMGVYCAFENQLELYNGEQIYHGTIAGFLTGSLFAVSYGLWYSTARNFILLSSVAGTGMSGLQILYQKMYGQSIREVFRKSDELSPIEETPLA